MSMALFVTNALATEGAGTGLLPSGSGRPYFVMELVRGVKLTEFCDPNRLSTEARLKLFIPVCQAVHHAPRRGLSTATSSPRT